MERRFSWCSAVLTFIFLERKAGEDGGMTARGRGGRFESRTAASVHAKHLPVSALRASMCLCILWSELTQKLNSVVFSVAAIFLLLEVIRRERDGFHKQVDFTFEHFLSARSSTLNQTNNNDFLFF